MTLTSGIGFMHKNVHKPNSHGRKHQKVNQGEPLHADLVCGTGDVVLETNWVFYMLLPLLCLEMEILDVFGLKMLALSLQAVDHSHAKSMPAHSQGHHFRTGHHHKLVPLFVCTLSILPTPTRDWKHRLYTHKGQQFPFFGCHFSEFLAF